MLAGDLAAAPQPDALTAALLGARFGFARALASSARLSRAARSFAPLLALASP